MKSEQVENAEFQRFCWITRLIKLSVRVRSRDRECDREREKQR